MSERLDKDWLQRQIDEQRREEEAAVEEAKARDHPNGKEPFDFQRFQTLYDITTFMGNMPNDMDRARHKYEVKYYVMHPNFQTMQELADHLAEMDAWGN